MSKATLISAALIVFMASSAFGIQETPPKSEETPKADATKIGIRVKLFDADRPTVALTPRFAFGYYRPGEGEEPQYLRDLKFEPQEKGFYLVTVPKGILLERLVITVQEPNYNAAVLTKVVTANEMVVYPGASDSKGVFSFQGFKGQLQTYAALYAELVEDLRLATPEDVRGMFGNQILSMPEADDLVRLPGLDARQREVARKLRADVLRTYGYLPPEAEKPTPSNAVVVNQCCKPRRCFRRCR